MKRFIKYMCLPALLLSSLTVSAAVNLTDARELIARGDYEAAVSMLKGYATKEPRNGTVQLLLGDCYRAMGNDAEAIVEYNKAVKNSCNDARLGLIEIAIREYRIDDADTQLADYRKGLKKGRKTLPDESDNVTVQLERTRNMLNRVEKIVVFDSINVPADEFFTYYRLSPESGSINPPSVLPQGFIAATPTVVYEPESRTEMMWAMPDADNNSVLVSSVALYGNEWDAPEHVGDHLGEGGDANYPFMMPDGITLYYANDGDNSLGGYDIFITRRDGNEFLQPQNLGMPYNSPYNDYMLAIDETTGVGWWASDRNRLDNMVTIYMFIPAEMRVNVDVTAPDILDRARLTSIKSTWEPGADYSQLKNSIANISRSAHNLQSQCRFTLPDG
ncbi:MAG: tetratricopeptide repeat protein, partial [Muribaculaceae bacterium]|nr:tetratricopeptide repeat protein [Muribaculaceae bacterium]